MDQSSGYPGIPKPFLVVCLFLTSLTVTILIGVYHANLNVKLLYAALALSLFGDTLAAIVAVAFCFQEKCGKRDGSPMRFILVSIAHFTLVWVLLLPIVTTDNVYNSLTIATLTISTLCTAWYALCLSGKSVCSNKCMARIACDETV